MKNPKILAIDDNPDIIFIMRSLMLESFPEVLFIDALSGKNGIELCLSEKPDVVLIEMVMPLMDGFEVCQKLKAHQSTKIIPIIMVTEAAAEKESRIKALECGADAFLTKPFDKSELTALVRAMIRIKESEDRKLDENERLEKLVDERTSKLKKSEARLKGIFENLQDAYFQADLSGKFTLVSHSSLKLYGYQSVDELIGQQAEKLYFNPRERESLLSLLRSAGRVEDYICQGMKKDGSPFWASMNVQFLYGNDRQVLGTEGVVRDITERKQAEDALRESEFFFKESQRAAFIGSYKFNLISDFWTSSEILEEIFGIDKNYSRNLNGWMEIVHPDDQEMMALYFSEEVLGKRNPFNKEYRIIRRSDGETRWVLGLGKLNFDAENNIIEMLGTIQDITERKQVEETFRESEEKYRRMVDLLPDAIIIHSEGKIVFANAAAYKLMGAKSPDQLLGKSAMDFVHPDDRALTFERIKKIYLTGEPSEFAEEKFITFNNELIDAEVIGIPVNYMGKTAVQTILRNITERKLTAEKIKASEDRYRSFISQVSEGVYRLESDEPMDLNLSVEEQIAYISDHMILAECNDAFVKMYGAGSQDEIIGKAHPFFQGNPDKPINRDALRNFILNGYRAENATTEEVNLSSQKLNFSNNSIGIIENNHLVRIWGTQTEITEKIKADKIQHVLYTISNAALSSVSLPKLIEIISNEIGKLMDSTNFYIAFFDEKTNMLSTIYEKDEKDVIDTWPAEKSITGYVIKKQKSLFVKDFEMEALVREGEIELFGTLSKVWLGVPLIIDKKAIGAVVVQSYDNPEAYTEKDKLMLEFVSHQISISIERKRAEQKLKLLNRAIDQSSVSIVITNKDGLIEFTNPKFTEVSGYSPEEAAGKNPRILKSGKHSKEFYRGLWQTLTQGDAWNGEICNRRKNGTLYWENVYISPVEGEDGLISHYVGIKEDITERKFLEETQRLTLEISQISISKTSLNSFLKVVHDKLNKIMRADNFYVALYDKLSDMYTLVYHVDKHDKFEINQPIKLNKGYTDIVRETGFGQLVTNETRTNPESKQKVVGYGKIPSAWLGVPLKSSSESEVIGVIAIQDYKNSNAYTKLEQQTLEVIAKDICVFIERIKNLEDLTRAKEKAEESDRLKSAFLANMSHEIRTPLNSIVGFADLLLDPEFDREQYADFAKIINNSGNSLLSIISDIMDISKIEAGQIKVFKTNFSVFQLIRQIHKQHSFVASEKGLELKMTVENGLETLVIESDENRIRQVLVNFIGNAIKFTTMGYVEIGAKVQDHVIRFHVKDTGIGIPQEYHNEIFDRFRQVEDADTRKYGGNGLGLAISKSLVELLGGQIGIESEQGKGSTFYFTVPLH